MASIVVSKSTGLGSNPGTPAITVCRPTGRVNALKMRVVLSSNLTKPRITSGGEIGRRARMRVSW